MKKGVDTKELKDFFLKNKYPLTLFLLSVFFFVFYFQASSFWPDESLYIWFAKNFFKEFKNISFFDVYLPVFLMSILNVFFGGILAGKIVIFLFFLLGVMSSYFLGKHVFGEVYGFFASLLLFFNPFFLFLSTRILMDVPLTSSIIFAVYCILMFEEKKTKKWAVLAGVAVTIPIFIKIAGILFFPVAIFYLLLKHQKQFLRYLKEKNTILFFSIPFFGFLLFFLNNYILFNSLLPSTQAFYSGAHIFGGSWNYYLLLLPDFFGFFVLIFLLMGSFFIIIRYRDFLKKPIFLFFLVGLSYFLFFSFFVGEKVSRYVLPSFPFFILISVYSMKILKYKKYKMDYVFFLLVLLICYGYLSSAHAMISSKQETYVGFPEAGEWIKNYANNNDIIYAGSVRSIRAFSGFDFANGGGNIRSLPKNFTEFLKIVNSTNKTIILETDAWEYTQPSWIYPLDKEKYDNLVSIGFNLYFYYPENKPAVFIFVK